MHNNEIDNTTDDDQSSESSTESTYSTASGTMSLHTIYQGKVSSTDRTESDKQKLTATEALSKVQTLLHKITTDKGNTLTTRSKTYITDIGNALKQITVMKAKDEEKIQKKQHTIAKQDKQVRQLQTSLKKTETTKNKIQSVIDKALQAHTARLEEAISTFQAITSKLQETQKEATTTKGSEITDEETITEGKTQAEGNTNNTPSQQQWKIVQHKRPSKSKMETNDDPPHRRTLIVKSAGAKKLTGVEIKDMLTKQRIIVPAPAPVIEDMAPRRTHVEVRCNTIEQTKQLQRTLQTHQTLNKQLSFTIKAAPTQKMILLGVCTGYEKHHIKKAFTDTYDLTDEEITILGNRNTRNQDTENWIIVLPIHTAKEIISKGGIQIAFQKCRISPFTSITRCRRCQRYGHTTAKCSNPNPTCENCGEEHDTTDCAKTPSCYNCKYSNEHNHTEYSTDHKSSDTHCEAYRTAYTEERRRINNIFYEEKIDRQETTYQQERHALLPTPPLWFYRPYRF